VIRRIATRVAVVGIVATGITGAPAIQPAGARSAAVPAPATYAPITPKRVLESSVSAQHATTLKVLGAAQVPATGVTAVALTVTVGRPGVRGFVTVYADGTARPTTSNVNFDAGRAQSDQVYAPVGSDGRVALYNGSTGAIHVYVDITGYFASAASAPAGSFVTTAPSRVLDTRPGDALAARTTKTVSLLGHGGVPASGVSAVVMTLTSLHSGDGGYLTAFASGTSRPATGNVYFAPGQAIGNQVVAQLGADGKVAVYNGSDGPVDLIGDVQGYFISGPVHVAGAYVPVAPTRIGSSTVGPRAIDGMSWNAYPEGPSGMALVNVTVSQAGAAGYVVAYGAIPHPPVTSLTFAAGRATAGLVAAPADSPSYGPYERVYNGSDRAARYTYDYLGYFLSSAASAGTVTDATTGAGVGGVVVFVSSYTDTGEGQDLSGGPGAVTAPDGTYTITGGEYVCFDARRATGPSNDIGYLSKCYQNQPYDDPGYADTATLVHGPQIVDQALPQVSIGTVAGRVTISAGGGLGNVLVRAGTGEAVTDSSGAYSMTVPVGSYQVCFDAADTPPGSTPYGYNSPCHSAVAVTRGTTTRVDETLLAEGAIKGRVVQTDGSAVPYGNVTVFANGVYVHDGTLDSGGNYIVTHLDPTVQYKVCISGGTADASPYGLAAQCYSDVAWNLSSYDHPAPGATSVAVPPGGSTTINATLAAAGGISGTVTAASTATALSGADVRVFRPDGSLWSSATTDDAGHYAVFELAAGRSYTVCIDPTKLNFNGHHYTPRCYANVAWSGAADDLPSGTTPVPVTGAADHPGVDVAITEA
jgi:hypothetical protein